MSLSASLNALSSIPTSLQLHTHSWHPFPAVPCFRSSRHHCSGMAASSAASTQADTLKSLRQADGAGPAHAEALAEDAIVWASLNGLLVGLGDDKRPRAAIHAPVSVLPVPFPRDSFEKAKKVMQIFNTLIDRVSRDGAYLRDTLRAASEFDDFTARLLQLYEATEDWRRQRVDEQLVLAINRSDYMLDEPSSTLLQVELNTIASSFGCLSTQVCKMHRYIVDRAGQPDLKLSNLPTNDVTSRIADVIGSAAAEFGTEGAAVLFIVQPDEKNSYDQQVGEQGSRDSSGNLFIDGQHIAVCYYRAGYAPTDYPSQAEWDARELMERSTAAQCPSVGYQLAGAKKIQQDLAGGDIVDRFVDSPEEATLIRACFAGLWSLDNLHDPETQGVLAEADARPDDFVLKPQREGGGNNLYGEKLQQRLRNQKGLAAYILMQRIRPPINRSMLLRNGDILEADTLSELGIYGTFIRRGNRVILNEEAGHLIRTKAATSDEGGVAAGFAVLDSPYLTD